MPRISCSDLGFSCDHLLDRVDEQELLAAVEEHARTEHGRELDDAQRERLRELLRAR